jgi:SAM-dependent methyltransferase
MILFGTEVEPLAQRIAAPKESTPDPGFPWYPYSSLGNLEHLKLLLGSSEGLVIDAARRDGVLDIGCGDGDLSFFFESLGCRVDAVDHPSPNHNGMRGVRRMKQELKSAVEIHEVDLDNQFQLPGKRYGLALFLGLLYHLKNPLYALEQVSRCAEYCVLSTRVARMLPGGRPFPEGEPLAYLLDSDELNRDNSNFWIFSNPGLRRILKLAKWETVKWLSLGDTLNSDPVSLERDERAFCLLRSHYGLTHVELGEGWYSAEATGWRWTARRFSARFQGAASKLTLQVYLPPEVFLKLGAMTLVIRWEGLELPPAVLDAPGEHSITRRVSRPTENPTVEFELDKALPPSPEEPRELGIIVSSLEVES